MDVKSRFPLLMDQPELVYLDSASSTQRADIVLKMLDHYYREMNANVHRGLYELSENATIAYEAVRGKIQEFINAKEEEEVIFTRGTTESLNIVAQGWGGKYLKEGDEVVLTQLEHHSNIVPWHMVAERTGAVVKFAPITDNGDLDYDALESLINDKTKMVSVTGLSNTLGTLVDIERVVKMARKVGSKVCVDAAQLVAHKKVDVQQLDVDFLAFSSHKIYGPTGSGVLYGKRDILEAMDPWLGGGDMIKEVHEDHYTWNDLPWKFEAGTPAIAQVMGMGAAVAFLDEVGMDWIEKHDRELMEYSLEKLGELDYVTVLGVKDLDKHVGALSFVVKDVHPHDVSAILGENNVCVRAGHHCTMTLMKALDVVSTSRVSFGVYNRKPDVDRLVEALDRVSELFRSS